jgi:hypothetical protein
LIFKHRLGPLLSGTIAVDKVLLERPDITLVTTDKAPVPAEPEQAAKPKIEEAGDGGLRLEVALIEVRDGRLLIQKQTASDHTEQSLEMVDLNIVLSDLVFDPKGDSVVQRISGQGRLEAQQVSAGSLPLRDLEGDLAVDKGLVEIKDLSFSMDQGDLEADLTADLGKSPLTYKLTATGDPLNVNEVVGLGENGTLGPGSLQLNASGIGTDPRGLKADGVLKLTEGRIPSHSVLSKTQGALGLMGLVDSTYESTETTFQLANKKLEFTELALQTNEVGLTLGGWAHLDGQLELDLSVRAQRSKLQIEKVPPRVLDSLADEEGWVAVPVRVTGTRYEPNVVPDTDALLTQARKGGRRVIQERPPQKRKGIFRRQRP